MAAIERCTTVDCGRIATRLVFVEEAEPPDWYGYCEQCAAVLNGEPEMCPNCEKMITALVMIATGQAFGPREVALGALGLRATATESDVFARFGER